MSTRISMTISGELPDEACLQAVHLARITSAWETFLEALKELPLESSIAVGPVKPVRGRPRRSRARLAAVPDSAA